MTSVKKAVLGGPSEETGITNDRVTLSRGSNSRTFQKKESRSSHWLSERPVKENHHE